MALSILANSKTLDRLQYRSSLVSFTCHPLPLSLIGVVVCRTHTVVSLFTSVIPKDVFDSNIGCFYIIFTYQSLFVPFFYSSANRRRVVQLYTTGNYNIHISDLESSEFDTNTSHFQILLHVYIFQTQS